MKKQDRFVHVLFLSVVVIAAITAHAGALTITTKDTVSIATKSMINPTTWVDLAQGDIAGVSFTAAQTVKIGLVGALKDQKVEPIVQINPGASLVVSANHAGGDAEIVQVGKDKIEGYYSYGKSSTYPWGIYWCIHDIGGKPMIVFSEFSKRSVWYSPISSDKAEEIAAILNKGDIPDITLIQEAAGA
jgi:hypothetical protein